MVETTDFLPGGGMVNIGNATEPWKEIHAEQMYVNGNLVTPNEDGEHVPTSRKINNKPLSDDITLTAGDVGAAASSHTHDDRYYTENEIDTKLGGKANSSHGNHVPTTESANNARFLRNDNTWQTVTAGNIGAAPSSHSHNYAGSSSAGGAATSANKLNTNAGDANTPVYFSNGVPVACTGGGSVGAYISESKYNSDGSWYRKWSDGWIEQGGYFISKVTSYMEDVVTYLKPFKNTNYGLFVTIGITGKNDAPFQAAYTQPIKLTTTSFTKIFYPSDGTRECKWYACGMGA